LKLLRLETLTFSDVTLNDINVLMLRFVAVPDGVMLGRLVRDALISDVVFTDSRVVIHTESKINPKENIFNLKQKKLDRATPKWKNSL